MVMLKTKSGKVVSKIGIGTWTIDKNNIDKELEALNFYYQNGVNYIDVVLAYDNGKVLDVVNEFLKTIKREDIFINAFITFGCNELSNVEAQIDYYLSKLNTNYLDCVTLHTVDVLGFSFNEYVAEICRLKETGKFLNIGYSNLSPDQLNLVVGKCDIFEGLYNLECKHNEDNDIIDICKKNNIAFYAYQPLRRNRTALQNYPVLIDISNNYNMTQNQVLLNWMILHKKIGVMIKSSNVSHIAENLDSINYVIKKEDYLKLDNFRSEKFDNIVYSYVNEEGKIRIDQIPNQ